MPMSDEEFLKSFDEKLATPEPVEETPVEEPETPEVSEQEPEAEPEEVPAPEEEGEVPSEEGEKEETPDYEAFYKEVLQPFKANGKTIELRDAREAVQLMQMGANYTRKAQELSKHRKTLALLEDNGIASAEDVAFLIDLKKNNPAALRKLLKDNNIDPLDIDTSAEVDYKPQVRQVSDKDLEARSVLGELNSTPEGAKTLNMLAETWDEESTQYMWNNPQTFKLIHEQRESGVFDNIMNEVERQTTLGVLSPGGSILEKYHTVGNQLYGQTQQQNTRRPIDTRTASRSSANNSNRAKAAGSPRASNRTSMVMEDLARLDDDAFLAAMKARL